MWRLWPSAFLWIAIYVFLAFFFNSSGAFGPAANTAQTSIAAALQVANLYFPICAGAGNCGANAVYWSLSLEEQFYFLFPFLVFFLPRKKLLLVFAALIVAQLLTPRPTASLLWSIRTDAIAFGILISMLTSVEAKLPKEGVLSSAWVRWTIFAALIYALTRTQIIFPSIAPGVTAMVSAALVLIASKSRDLLVPSGRVRSLMVYLGGRSYAIYLIHEAAFFGTREIWYRFYPNDEIDAGLTVPFAIIASVIILAAAEINYRLVENPLRKIGRRIADQYTSPRQRDNAVGSLESSELT